MIFKLLKPHVALAIMAIGVLIWMFLSYAIGVLFGGQELCFPPLRGCNSISEAGTTFPASIFYRAFILPLSVVSFVVWIFFRQYLIFVFKKENLSSALNTAIKLGLIGSFFSIVGQSVLGGPIGRTNLIHTIPSIISIFFNLTAQIIISLKIKNIVSKTPLIISGLNLFLIVTLGLLDLYPGVSSRVGKIAEWNCVILLQVWFLLFFNNWKNGFEND